jgi:hypothetical protein
MRTTSLPGDQSFDFPAWPARSAPFRQQDSRGTGRQDFADLTPALLPQQNHIVPFAAIQ